MINSDPETKSFAYHCLPDKDKDEDKDKDTKVVIWDAILPCPIKEATVAR